MDLMYFETIHRSGDMKAIEQEAKVETLTKANHATTARGLWEDRLQATRSWHFFLSCRRH